LEKGSGPRHLVFHQTLRTAYVVNELRSTVSVFSFQDEVLKKCENGNVIVHSASDPSSVLVHKETQSSLPPEWESKTVIKDGIWKAASHSSEIRLHPNGRFLYIGNRGHDSIAVFRVLEDGLLERVGLIPSGGNTPRNFNFDHSGKWLVVGNQNSNNIITFRICQETGLLTQASKVACPSPNYVFNYGCIAVE